MSDELWQDIMRRDPTPEELDSLYEYSSYYFSEEDFFNSNCDCDDYCDCDE